MAERGAQEAKLAGLSHAYPQAPQEINELDIPERYRSKDIDGNSLYCLDDFSFYNTEG